VQRSGAHPGLPFGTTRRESKMDDDRTARGFQRWLDLLDETEVQVQVDDIQRELEQLQRRRDLLVQALALKAEWDAMHSPDESVFDQSPMNDESEHFSVSEDSGQDQGEGLVVGGEQHNQNGW
jgi:hypothetical protein